MILIFTSFIGSQGALTLMGGHCHTLPQFDLMEPHHAHTHLMTDCDLTQSRHCHAGQCRTASDPAISNISGHLQTGRDSMLTAHCRQDNGPISEPSTETELMARACHYHHPEICYEFDMQKLSI